MFNWVVGAMQTIMTHSITQDKMGKNKFGRHRLYVGILLAFLFVACCGVYFIAQMVNNWKYNAFISRDIGILNPERQIHTLQFYVRDDDVSEGQIDVLFSVAIPNQDLRSSGLDEWVGRRCRIDVTGPMGLVDAWEGVAIACNWHKPRGGLWLRRSNSTSQGSPISKAGNYNVRVEWIDQILTTRELELYWNYTATLPLAK